MEPKKPRQQVTDLETVRLTPQADPSSLDHYTRPGLQSIGAPPDDNPMLQLARSLKALDPVGQEMFQKGWEKQQAYDDADIEQKYNSNRDEWNKKIRAGEIPLGVSPHAMRAAHRLYLKSLASDYETSATLAFNSEEGAEARASNNPATMKSFLEKQRGKYREQLEDAQGKSLVSPLDLQEVYTPALEKVDSALMRTHAAHRVADTEKTLVDSVSLSMNATMTRHLTDLNPSVADDTDVTQAYEKVAADIADVMWNKDHGAITNGLDRTKGAQLIVEQITGHAIRTGDMSTLNLLDHIKTPDGHPIGHTREALKAREQAEEKITSLGMQRAHFERWKQSLPFEDQQRERRLEIEKREDERYQRELAKVQEEKGDDAVKANVEILERRVLQGLRRDSKDGPGIVSKALEELAAVDPKAAVRVEGWTHELMRLRQDVVDDPLSLVKSRIDIAKDPSKVSYDDIFSKLKSKQIGPASALRLVGELERAKEDSEHQFMKSQEFKGTLSAIHNAVVQSSEEPNSPEVQAKGLEALAYTRDLAAAYIKQHPQASEAEFRTYLRTQVKPTLQLFHEDFNASENKKEGLKQQARGQAVVDAQARKEADEAEKRQAKIDKDNQARDEELKRLSEQEKRMKAAFEVMQDQERRKRHPNMPEMNDSFARFRNWLLGK